MCLVFTGCSVTPAGKAQAVDLGDEVTLTPGATVSVKITDLKVRFVSVTEDSRCPRDVTCFMGPHRTGAQSPAEDALRLLLVVVTPRIGPITFLAIARIQLNHMNRVRPG